jgi:hypothetical protein
MDLDDALVAVAGAANPEWKLLMHACLVWLAETRAEFTTDDAWEAMEHYYPEVTTPERRAIGPIIKELITDQMIEKVDYTTSRRPIHHKAHLVVYQAGHSLRGRAGTGS